jgi:hypothetical protein
MSSSDALKCPILFRFVDFEWLAALCYLKLAFSVAFVPEIQKAIGQ